MARRALSLGLQPTLQSAQARPQKAISTCGDGDLLLRVRRHVALHHSYDIALFAAAERSGVAGGSAAYGCGATFAPGESASWPVTTTVSSAFTPLSITV